MDFTPGAVRILIDRMKKDKDVGAACGRIHPIGNGLILINYAYLIFILLKDTCTLCPTH